MKVGFPLAAVAACIALGACSPERGLQRERFDYKAARERAAKENKLVLLDFTGSDWCGLCIQLEKETFSKPEFQEFAGENLVFVKLDFPRRKEQSAELRRQNSELAHEFGVQGFPTLVLLNSQGRELARNAGYLGGGPEGFVNWVQSAGKP
jgi:protein disulfide-isomerase